MGALQAYLAARAERAGAVDLWQLTGPLLATSAGDGFARVTAPPSPEPEESQAKSLRR